MSSIVLTAQIDRLWTVAMMENFLDWFGKDPRAAEYRHLTKGRGDGGIREGRTG